MHGRGSGDQLHLSLSRQRRLLAASIILTPVDNIPITYGKQENCGFLHGLYISDKVKTKVEQRNSIIQFAGRGRATFDVNRIHRQLADALGAEHGSLRLLSGLHAHIVLFMSLAGIGHEERRVEYSHSS